MDAYHKSTTKQQDKDRRCTPWPVIHSLEAILGMRFQVDACAEFGTSKAPVYWTKEQDALSFRWAYLLNPKSIVFMNPPYSEPGVWCEKAWQESLKGLIVVGLLPDDRSTSWYQQFIEDVAPIVYVPTKRISFINPSTGQKDNGNPKGAVIPVWMPLRSTKTNYERVEIVQ